MTNLPKRQQQLYDLLLGRGDVTIERLFGAISTPHSQGHPSAGTTRFQQHYLGPYISALNRRLAVTGLRVEPGALKNTYRLVSFK